MGKDNTKNKFGAKKRENDNNNEFTTDKKPFDKKKYREKKYSNKWKVEKWDERRKKAILRGFYKDLHKDQPDSQTKTQDQNTNEKSFKKKSSFFAAKEEYRKQKAIKEKEKEQSRKSRMEQEEASNNSRKKKLEINKKLSKKTRKGQPIMKDRLEMLLEKIKEGATAD